MAKSAKEKKPSKWTRLRTGRRVSQILFFSVFIFLILATASLTGSGFDAENSSTVPYPVEAFLNIDPYIASLTALSTHTLPKTLLWSLIVLGSAFFLGRAFCSWICPMGSVNHAFSELKPSLSAGKKRKANNTKPGQKIKYVLLVVFLTAAALGSAIGGLFDPISLITRGIALTILPTIDFILSDFISLFASSNTGVLQRFSDNAFDAVSGTFVHANGILVSGGFVLSLFFIFVLLANRIIPRFWCRYLCPFGALLGLTGRFGIFTLKKDDEKCTNCGKCEQYCSGAASPLPGQKWQRSECDMCFNCVAVCKDDALKFGLVGSQTNTCKDTPDIKRRHLLGAAATGVALVPTLRAGAVSSPEGRPDPSRIRPPGSVDEEEFLKRCIRCGQCMKICPNNALHPALDEAGMEGLWTPVLVPKVGYCEPTCTLCSQVCPTAAIKRVTENEKTGQNDSDLVRIGTAFFDRGRCLPWAMATQCTVCEEFCPMSPKAIYTEEVERTINGKTIKLKLPYIDPAKCSGCGACENVCPVHDKAAVRVTCAGESRSSKNKLLL